MTRRFRWIGALVLVGMVAFTARPEAQAVVTAQINSFWNMLKAGKTDAVSGITYAFTNLQIIVGGYANFGTTLGVNGYGIRDSGGVIQIKNSGGSWTTPAGGTSPNSTYLTQTADISLPNSQALGALGSGLVFNTTITGVQSIYGGSTCTNQFVSALSAAGVATCSSLALATTTITGTLLAANFPALTGDITTAGGALATTLATVNSNVGSFGSSTAMGTFTVNGKGLITAAANVTPQLTLTSTYFSSLSGANLTALTAANISAGTAPINISGNAATATAITGALPAANFPTLTGDVTTPGASLATTLATVNSNVGSFGSSTAMGAFTVNGKGLITAASSVTPQLTLTSTYFSSLAATNLTGIPGANVTGTLATVAFPSLTGDVTNTGGTLATTVGKIGGSAVALGSAFTTVGAGGLTLTIGGATSLTLPTTGTLVSTTVTSLPSLVAVATLGTGVWQGTVIAPTYGGTGVANTGTITLGGNLTTAGAFATTFTMTAGTTVTFPTTGTLVNTAVTSLPYLAAVGTLNNVAGSGTLGTVPLPFASLIIGTAATNNLTVTPASFAAGVVGTIDDPGFTTVKLPLVKRGTITFTSGAILGGACATVVTGTLTGLASTSTVTASLAAAVQTNWQKGVTFFVYPTVNTINLQVCNPTSGSLSPETASFNFTAIVP